MKKFVIGATAALVATLSIASTADAGWRWKNHGWRHHNHWGVVVVSPRYYGDYCFVKKVKRYDAWGNLYVKRVRVC
jgi:hypothetical protein